MAQDKLVYIIVLNFNGYKDTIDCIRSIFKSTYLNYKVIIVDNYSDDSSVTKLQKYISSINISYHFCKFSDDMNNLDHKITLIESEKNLGYAGGNNIGLKYALKDRKFSYVWILNNDTIVSEDSLFNLISNSNDSTVYGCKIINYNNSKKIESLGGRINKLFLTTKHNHSNKVNSKLSKDIKQIDYIHGTSVFMHRKVIEKLGLLDESYFMYYEDVDYSIRALNNGYRLAVNQDSEVFHNSNYKKYINSKKSILRKIYPVVNRYRLSKKHYKHLRFVVLLGIILAILKRIFTFRIKESILIIKYLLKI